MSLTTTINGVNVTILKCGCLFNADTGEKIHATDTMSLEMQEQLDDIRRLLNDQAR